MLHFSSVQSVLKDSASVSETFDKFAEKYCEVINRLGQVFENWFCDLDQLKPCVPFISNPLMNVDTTCFAEQLSATFNLDAQQVEIEIITLQMTSKSKPTRLHQPFVPCWHRELP